MNKVFNFQEDESYNLRSGTHLPSRNMNTAHFGTDTISTLGPKLWKLIPDKIKHASTLSAFKAKIKSWTINNNSCRICKIFVKDFGFVKFVRVSNGIHTNAYSFFFLKKRKQRFKIKLRTLKIFDTVGPSIRTKNYIIINTINF